MLTKNKDEYKIDALKWVLIGVKVLQIGYVTSLYWMNAIDSFENNRKLTGL